MIGKMSPGMLNGVIGFGRSGVAGQLALLVLLSAGATAGVLAQQADSAARLPNTADAPASATEAAGAPKRAWTITPRITLQETFTDNVEPGARTKVRDQITEINPGVRIVGQSARAKMNLDYSVREMIYGRNSRGNQTQQALNAVANLEAIEKFLFVDMSGVISQQTISALGVQSPANYSINDNSTETSNFRISPFVRGKLAGFAEYEGRYSRSKVHSKSSQVGDTDIEEWRGMLKGNTRVARLDWSLEAGQQGYDYKNGRKTESDTLRGLLAYNIAPEWKVSASIGRERNDFASLEQQNWQTHGYGLDWKPNNRTDVSAFREKRFFGHGHTLSINHRLPYSALKYSDTRDISSQSTQPAVSVYGTVYDLLFTQLASTIPDEAMRADYLARFLQQTGISPSALVISSFLSSQVSVQRRQELSYVLRGARNTATVAVNRSQNDQLGIGLGGGSAPVVPAAIKQRGVSVSLSHQLSALSSLNVNGIHSRNTGSSELGQRSTQKTLSAGFSTRLGAKTSAGLTARRTEFDSEAAPYTEKALIGTLTMQF